MLFIYSIAAILLHATVITSIEVETTLGKIRGITLVSRLGAEFYAFRGIRYAEPPLGELRFKNPKPVKPWRTQVFDATVDGPKCPQVRRHSADASEDCLRINVYTKNLHGNLPVIFYLHPGGFYSVTAQSKFAGPDHFMDRDIVLVTINYRLATFGFLATGSADAPGNAGLKDQVIALRWVREHIRSFGGNPDSVTLLGYSAGSTSIGLHMLSPMSKGLFHRGIAMSASPFAPWNYENDGIALAKRQARLLNCTDEPMAMLVQCLRQKPMNDFVDTAMDMFEFGWHPIFNWKPVIETDFGQERFLIEQPYKTIQSADVYKVPLITGITEYEFLSAAYYLLQNNTQLNLLNSNFDKYAPILFIYERDTRRSKEISERLRSKYLNNQPIRNPQSLFPLGELFSDAVIGFQYHRFLDLVSRLTPVYTYLFKYKGRYSHLMAPDNRTFGAHHHDELLYLFRVPLLTPEFLPSDPENSVIEHLTRMWSEFARTGNPNNPSDEYLKNLDWKLYNRTSKDYLEIGNELVSKTGGVFEERYRIWDELFPVPKY